VATGPLAPESTLGVSDLPQTDLDWAEAHLAALYQRDSNERLTGLAQPDRGAPPRVHLVRTRLGVIWRFAADLGAVAVRDVARYAALERGCALDATTPPPPPERLEPIRRVLEAHGPPVERVWSGPAYRLPDATAGRAAIVAAAQGAEVVTDADDPRLAAWAGALGEPLPSLRAALPIAVSLFEGRVVSACFVARGDASGFVEAGVETAPSARGHGHAPRCVAAWARAIEARGGHPLYSTAWTNRASRRVAMKLGLEIYAEDWHLG